MKALNPHSRLTRGLVPLFRHARRTSFARLALLLPLLLVATSSLRAQTGGEAGIQGTVTDSSGAAIPNATVIATNDATGVATARQTSSDGLYTISPVIPGTYTVKASRQRLSGVHPEELRYRRAQTHRPQHHAADRLRRNRGHRLRRPARD